MTTRVKCLLIVLLFAALCLAFALGMKYLATPPDRKFHVGRELLELLGATFIAPVSIILFISLYHLCAPRFFSDAYQELKENTAAGPLW